MNDSQRHHLAQTCQIVATGQLAYFGFRMFSDRRIVPFALSTVIFLILEASAVVILRGHVMYDYILLGGIALAMGLLFAFVAIYERWPRNR